MRSTTGSPNRSASSRRSRTDGRPAQRLRKPSRRAPVRRRTRRCSTRRRSSSIDPTSSPRTTSGCCGRSDGKSVRRRSAPIASRSRASRGFPPSHFRLGRLYEQRGWDRLAVKEYAKALRLDPQMRDPAAQPPRSSTRVFSSRVSLVNYPRDLAVAAMSADQAYADEGRFRNVPVDRPLSIASDVEDPSAPEPSRRHGHRARDAKGAGHYPAPARPDPAPGRTGTAAGSAAAADADAAGNAAGDTAGEPQGTPPGTPQGCAGTPPGTPPLDPQSPGMQALPPGAPPLLPAGAPPPPPPTPTRSRRRYSKFTLSTRRVGAPTGYGIGKNWRSVATPAMRRRNSEIRPETRAPATGSEARPASITTPVNSTA